MIQTSEYLEMSVQSVYNAVMRGELNPEKHFSRNFFTKTELDRYINQKQIKNGKRHKRQTVDI